MTTKQDLMFDSTIAILTVLIATFIAVSCKATVYTTVAMGTLGGVFFMAAKGVVKAIITSKPKSSPTTTCKWKECASHPGYYTSPHIKQQIVNAAYITVRPYCSKCGKKIELVK